VDSLNKWTFKLDLRAQGSQAKSRPLRPFTEGLVFLCVCVGLSGLFSGTAFSKTTESLNSEVPVINLNPAPRDGIEKIIHHHKANLIPLKSVITHHNIKVRKGDTLRKIFNRQGLSTKDLQAILNADNKTRYLAQLQAGQLLKVQVNSKKEIENLHVDFSRSRSVVASRFAKTFRIEQREIPFENQLAFGKGKINESLSSSAKRAGLDHKVVAQMVDIFASHVDFTADLKPSDSFRVLFEEKYIDGEKFETGHILAAELKTKNKTHQAIRYTDKEGQTGYFAPDGSSKQQAFLRTPVDFTRISSQFGKRRHPILHKLRNHKGTDFAAPLGTPVQATAEGRVIYAAKQRGYGNVIKLQHGHRHVTLYAHLSRFAQNLKVGMQVKQGQVIGYVGHTGLARGDHLHYEFLVDNIHRDPLTATFVKNTVIPGPNKREFFAHAKEMLRLMDQYEHKIKMASADLRVNE